MDEDELYIEYAYRIGRDRRDVPGVPKKSVLCTFSHSSEVDMVMRLAKKLKGTAFAIDRDYPAEISAARKKLWPEVKRLRSAPNVNVQLKFPAKIVLMVKL